MTIVTTTRGRNGSGTPSTPIQTKDIADGAVTDRKIDEAYRQEIANAVDVSYSALKYMRDNSELVAGQFYRITDYVTTTVQAETQSAGHAFDVVVKALSENVLSEEASAAQHNGDTYFDNCKLDAWELKYSLDNDTTRFAWADTENGKGVIYHMKDEYNNECPYDFKNIQFKLYAGTGSGWTTYLSSTGASATTIVPYRLTRAFNGVSIGIYTWNITTNDYTYAYTYSGYNDKTTTDKTLHGEVHDCLIGNNWATVQKDDTETYKVLSLNFIVAIPFLLSQKDDTFNVYGNDFGINCHDVIISDNCYSNKLGDSCYNIHTQYSCYSWTCGDNCYSWSCGNSCNSWSCGNYCYSWNCGNYCGSWACGNSCNSWRCGNYCSHWTCGNDCSSWKIGTSNSLGNYVSNFHLGNGIKYLYISSTSTPTSASPLTNFIIKNGVGGVDNNSGLDIIIDNEKFPLNAGYQWTIAKNSKGEIVQYCEADLIQ